jgi:YVTN family beta-propeller protein
VALVMLLALLPAAAAVAQSVVATIPPPSQLTYPATYGAIYIDWPTTGAVAADPQTNMTYVADDPLNLVQVIGGNNIASTVAVGYGPYALAVDDNPNTTPPTDNIYVANENADTVTVINANNGYSATTIPVGGGPIAIAVDDNPNTTPPTDNIYVADIGGNTVTVINANNSFSTSTISVGSVPDALAVDDNSNTTPPTDNIYVANVDSNTVTVISANNGFSTTTIPVGSYPWALAVDDNPNTTPPTDNIYVANANSGAVTVINANAGFSTSTITVGDTPEALAVDDDPAVNMDNIYVANWGSGTVTVINGNNGFSTTTIPVGNYPNTIAVEPNTHQIFVASYCVISASEELFWCPGDNLLTVITPTFNSNTNSYTYSTTTVDVGWGPDAIAVNAATNMVYTANFDSVSVINATASPLPASTTTVTNIAPSPTAYEVSTAFTATVTPAGATGSVYFYLEQTISSDSSSQWAIGSAALNGSGQATLTVAAMPATSSGTTAVIAVYTGDSNFAGSASAATTVPIKSPSPVASPTSLSFTALAHTVSPPQMITLTNNGAGPEGITRIHLGGSYPTQFQIVSDNCPVGGYLSPGGGECTISVDFSPTQSSPTCMSAYVGIDFVDGNYLEVTLNGCLTVPTSMLSPSSLSFGNQMENTNYPTQNVLVTNTGSVALTITSITISAPFSQTNNCPLSPATLGVGNQCTIAVTFYPTGIASYAKTLTVTVKSPGTSGTVALTGTGVGPVAGSEVSFGSATRGGSGKTENITVSNPTGNPTLTLNLPPTVTTTDINGLSVFAYANATTCGATLAGGTSCTVTIKFSPQITELYGTSHTGNVTITGNIGAVPIISSSALFAVSE